MRVALLLVLSLLIQRPVAPPAADPIDRVIGAWEGTVEHDGETRRVILEFARSGDRVIMAVSLPAIHAWRFPAAVATIEDGRITAGSATIEFDASANTLTTAIPSELVPKYALKTTLRRRGPVKPDPRPPLEAPRREPVWTARLGAPAWADVAFVDGQVIAGAEDGTLRAFDTRGRERWTFKADGAIRARVSPVARDVVVQADDGMLYRIDGRTGKMRWRVPVSAPITRVALADPASRYENRASAVAVEGDRLYAGTHDGRIAVLDARDGRALWAFRTADAVIATPVVAGGRVFCGSFDGNVYALDAATGALAWKHDTGGAVTSAVAVSGDRVLAGSRSYDFMALDAKTGARLWTRYFWFSWVESPATVMRSAAYVGSSDAAKVFSIDTSTGRVIWAADVGGSAWGQPAVTDAAVYQGVAGVLHYIAPHHAALAALDRSTGRALWTYAPPPPDPAPSTLTAYGFAGSVAVGGDLVFAAGLDGTLYAFRR
jgi:outer membrane protein assembly factor BamB